MKKTDEPVKKTDEEPSKKKKEARVQGSKTENVFFGDQAKMDKADGPSKRKASV